MVDGSGGVDAGIWTGPARVLVEKEWKCDLPEVDESW
jgi:hypothetical protein